MELHTIHNKITQLNVKKAIRYCKKNGLSSTYYAVRERMEQGREPYEYTPISQEEWQEQKVFVFAYEPLISILVPTYETDSVHLIEMIESVLEQSYAHFELILADASETEQVRSVVSQYTDERIRYYKLGENKGISCNTNEALTLAKGEYCSLLDHDDLLTRDALYEIVRAINQAREGGIVAELLYSDEDKTDSNAQVYMEPHRKPSFNLDLFLSNNYICHFTTIKSERLKALRLRGEYDGAQDYDLFLRVVDQLTKNGINATSIIAIPRVLYHWRCHEQSTAVNPASKMYAYDAGKRAVEDFLHRRGVEVTVSHTKHLGFYRVNYGAQLFKLRPDIAAVGAFQYGKGCIVGGAYDEQGNVLHAGLPRHYSGYMNRATLQQDVYALDIRTIHVRKQVRKEYETVLLQYGITSETFHTIEEDVIRKASMEFAGRMRRQGKILFLDPRRKG